MPINTGDLRMKGFLLLTSTSSCYALQAVPRGSRDGELVNKRRATSAQTNGYDLGNASIIISRFFDRLIHLIESDLLFFCNMISENLLISNYTQQIDTCRNALQRKRGLISIYLLRLFKQTAAYLIEFDVSQATTGN